MPRAGSHRHEPPERPESPEPPEFSDSAHGPADSSTALNYTFTRRSIREVDRIAISEYGMAGIVLMENAARGLANVALSMLAHARRSQRQPCVIIFCGSGNNGGDGYALARFLHNAHCNIRIHPLAEPRPGSDAAINRTICERMAISIQPITQASELRDADLLVDAIFGTGLDRPIEGTAAELIAWINDANRPVLAVDLPSGMDCDTGKPLGPCIKAAHTVTFVGNKLGFESLDAQKLLGEVSVVDIGVPRELVARLGTKTTRSPLGRG